MSDQRLLDTIKHKLSIGVSEQEIIKTLVALGWKEEDIKTTILSANSKEIKQDIVAAPQNIQEPIKKKKNILPAVLILVILVLIASGVLVYNILKMNPNAFSNLSSLFKKQPTGQTQEVIPTTEQEVVVPSPEGTRTYGPYDSASKLAMAGEKFVFFYEKDGYQYININGSVSGPYQRYEKKGIPRSLIPSVYETKYGYSFYNGTKGWFVNIDGTISGPYSDVSNVFYSRGGYIYAAKEKEDIYFNVNVNNKKYGPYISIDNAVYLSDNGFYGFSYISKSKRYINMNGTVFGPYDNVGNGVMYRNEKFYFIYSENGKQYVNVNGNIYEIIESNVYDYQKSIFSISYNKDGKKYVNINGNEVLAGEQTELAQNHIFKKDDGYHVSINGQEKGIYVKTTPIYTDKNSYIFGYQAASGQWYVNISGVDKGPYQSVYSDLFINNGHYGFVFQKDGVWNVEVK